jgi:hypothetical protein
VQTRRHDELARPSGRRRPEQRRLDLAETLRVHRRAQRRVDERAQSQVALHVLASQVEVAIAQAHLLVDVDAVVELERRRLGRGQDLDDAVGEFDLAGRELGRSPCPRAAGSRCR